MMNAGCLEVCKLGPVVFYSGDPRSEALRERTWYTRVSSDSARQIVQEHLGNGEKVTRHLYPPMTEQAIEDASQPM